MNIIIEKIRAEVERLMQEEQQEIKDMEGALVPNLRSYTKGKRDAFIDTLIVLDKLKELPITRDFNFDDEVVKWIQEHSDVDGTYSGIDFARHFYELGRQSKPVLSDDLEKAAREYAMDDFYNGYSSGSIIEDTMKNFKAGVEWGRRNLLQEIADGKTHPVDGITAAWLDNTDE